MIKTKLNLRQIIGTGIVLAAAGLGSLVVSGGCQPQQTPYEQKFNSLSPEEKARWKQAEYNLCVQGYEEDKKKHEQILKMHEDFRKQEQIQNQNNYQNMPQQSNLEKDAEEAITHGAGDFVGDVLFYEYLKK